MRLPFKALLILAYLAAGHASIAQRVASLGLSPALLFYGLLFTLLAGALLIAAHVRYTPLRLLYAIVFSASAMFLQSTESIMGDHLSYDAFINLLNSIGFAGDAADQHGPHMVWAALATLPLLLGIAVKPRWTPPLPSGAVALAPLGGVALLSALMFVRGGDGGRGLPSAFPPLAYGSIYLYEMATGDAGLRQEVALAPKPLRQDRDIVLLVDESVLGAYLDIAGEGGVRSGLMEQRSGARIFNYGRAASITNCSVGTNVTLRHGGTREDYQRINATMPSIWDYAHKAGFRTVYVDAQRMGGQLHNLMTVGERAAIDHLVQFDGVPVRNRDMAVADTLVDLLGNERREFILVNKVGAHFPVHDKFPDDFMRYRPVLARGAHEDVSDTGNRDGFAGDADSWLRYRNSYRNTLLWNVGAFFDRLLARADLSRATIIYTSDHGQDLHERGRAGVNTHCSSSPVPEEGNVPLVVIEGAASRTLDWERHLAANRNKVSHYQIFPTLLALMGYDDAEVGAIYGDPLVAQSRDPGTFNTLFNARLGREPVWVPVAPADEAAIPRE